MVGGVDYLLSAILGKPIIESNFCSRWGRAGWQAQQSGKQGGRGQGATESPYPQGEPGQAGGGAGEQGLSGATHKGPAAQSACGGRQTPLSLLLSPPWLVSISLMLFTSSPNLSKEYDSHVFRFI